jgi:hypothetical protein
MQRYSFKAGTLVPCFFSPPPERISLFVYNNADRKLYRNDAFGTGKEGTKRKSKACVENRARKAQGKS